MSRLRLHRLPYGALAFLIVLTLGPWYVISEACRALWSYLTAPEELLERQRLVRQARRRR